MPLLPLAQTNSTHFSAIRLIATDMDGTLTQQGQLTPALLQCFDQLAIAQIPVLIVTGRSAGWVSALVEYLNIWGAIAENGGMLYLRHQAGVALTPIADWQSHRQALAQTFHFLQQKFPDLQESEDNRFRLTDWTFDVQGLHRLNLQTLQALCREQGWSFTYSNVQCHIKPRLQDKAAGLRQVLRTHFPDYLPEQVITVGDSPNDESLFNPVFFPQSVGVANVAHYQDQLHHHPTYKTSAAEGDGFQELVQHLLQGRAITG